MTGERSNLRGAVRLLSAGLGIGALVTGGIAVIVGLLALVVLVGPLLFWLAWDQLGLAQAVGLPGLGFWAIVLASLFLGVGWFGKVVITTVVFLVDPAWFSASATVRWPEPTMRNFLAIALLAVLAARPHARHRAPKRHDRCTAPTRRSTPAPSGH